MLSHNYLVSNWRDCLHVSLDIFYDYERIDYSISYDGYQGSNKSNLFRVT